MSLTRRKHNASRKITSFFRKSLVTLSKKRSNEAWNSYEKAENNYQKALETAAKTRKAHGLRGGSNAANLRNAFLRDFKKDFQAGLVMMLKKKRGDLLDLKRNLAAEVKKVYTSTDMHEHVDEEDKRAEVIEAAVEWLTPIVNRMIAAENARPTYAPRSSNIKRKFMKRSFLAGLTHRMRSPSKVSATRSKRVPTLSLAALSAALNMGSLSRALNDIF
jgi:signal transduction histidine kinase